LWVQIPDIHKRVIGGVWKEGIQPENARAPVKVFCQWAPSFLAFSSEGQHVTRFVYQNSFVGLMGCLPVMKSFFIRIDHFRDLFNSMIGATLT
jgi:hypothetical protein